MKCISPKKWSEFQHYKNRCPPWIKLHKALLDDYDFQCLPIASKALAPMLWLLASEYQNGSIPADMRKIAYRLHMQLQDLSDAIKPLIREGFFEEIGRDASTMLAECVQDACLEKETQEKKVETEKERSSLRSDAKKARRGLPEGLPAENDIAWAVEHWRKKNRSDLCCQASDQAEKFRDYHTAHGTKALDWPATWRTWARNAVEFNKPARDPPALRAVARDLPAPLYPTDVVMPAVRKVQ